MLLEIGKSYPYIIDGKEYNAIALIENNVMVPARLIESGYVRYNERVYNINELNIEERYINNNYKIIAIAPFHNSTVIEQNDIFMEKLQNIDELSKWDVNRLKKQIVSNIAYDVAMRF